MLIEKIKTDLIKAMKERDDFCVGILRLILAEIKNLEISKYLPGTKEGLCEEDILTVLQKMVKTHGESIEMFKKGRREDLVLKEEKELAIIKSYLPAELSEEEERKKVCNILLGISDKSNFGKVMGAVMGALKGSAEGNLVSKIVKEEMGK